MGDFIYFTEEQKERANAVQIADILRREHEEVERSGNEWRWKRHRSVTFRGSSWYRHSRQVGSHAIDFMQEFFGMSYPEAVSYLLDGEQGQLIERGKGQETKRKPGRAEKGRQSVEKEQTEERKEPKEPKELKLPEKNPTMKRVYAYLLQNAILTGKSSRILRRQEPYMNLRSITTLCLPDWTARGKSGISM